MKKIFILFLCFFLSGCFVDTNTQRQKRYKIKSLIIHDFQNACISEMMATVLAELADTDLPEEVNSESVQKLVHDWLGLTPRDEYECEK